MEQKPLTPLPAASSDGGAEAEPPVHGSASTSAAAPLATEEERRSLLDFEPVPVRARTDGWTPERQRAFIDALADSGSVLLSAAKVGMSEQSAHNLRKRAGAGPFNRAWEAAVRLSKSRLAGIAWQRAVEGVEVPYYYHGELAGTRRVFSDRLLMFLIANAGRAEPEEGELPDDPAPPTPEELEADEEMERHLREQERMDRLGRLFIHEEEEEEEDGTLYTSFPPPPGFDGDEYGAYGDDDYRRTLSPAEQAAMDESRKETVREEWEQACADRDFYFGFAGGRVEPEVEPEV